MAITEVTWTHAHYACIESWMADVDCGKVEAIVEIDGSFSAYIHPDVGPTIFLGREDDLEVAKSVALRQAHILNTVPF